MAVMGADYEEMKARQKRCVCRQCGNELEIRMIIFLPIRWTGIGVILPGVSADRVWGGKGIVCFSE